MQKPFFTFYVTKLKKCLCSKAPNQYLLTESHLDLLTMHAAMVKEHSYGFPGRTASCLGSSSNGSAVRSPAFSDSSRGTFLRRQNALVNSGQRPSQLPARIRRLTRCFTGSILLTLPQTDQRQFVLTAARETFQLRYALC